MTNEITNEELQKLKSLAEAATPGPWQAKDGYGAGLEIYMAHPQYPDKDWPAFGTDSAFCKKGLVAYETWVQFPNEVRDAAQKRNASYIAAANPATILALIAKVESLAADAERYRWLRMCDWFDSPLCVLRDPKKAVDTRLMLGADCPSRGRLDVLIDELMAKEKA